MPLIRLPAGIVFDAVGTLIHPEPSPAVVYATVGRQFGSRLGEAEIGGRLIDSLAAEEKRDRAATQRTSEAREEDRWRNIVGRVLDDVDDVGSCFAELFRYFSQPRAWTCRPDVAPVLRALKERGHLLALASNYDARLRTVVAGLPDLKPISQIVISAEVGWRKPAPEFFAAVCQKLALPARQILLVGDDPVHDYEGARRAGLSAVLLDPDDRIEGSGIVCIRRLEELIG